MMRSFDVTSPSRVVFGPDAEARVPAALAELGAQRVLLVCTARHREGADRLHAALGERSVGVLAIAEPQVPLAVAERARAHARAVGADWVVAHGGGTAVGLAKAIALEVDVRVGAVPTTYSGSEMTDIWGISADGAKTTGRDPRVRPALVAYDPALLVGLRPEIAGPSLANALAHSVEALYAHDATDGVRDRAEESVRALVAGLRGGLADLEAVSEALYGAYLAGDVLRSASMALHHKLAHVLGGSFGTPHAPTHTVLLPHTLAYNAAAAPEAVRRLAAALGTTDPAATLWDLFDGLGLPTRLSAHGFTPADVPRAVELALQRRYPNPRALDADGLSALLHAATLGRRPGMATLALDGVTGTHAGLPAASNGDLRGARRAVIAVHGRGGTAEKLLRDARALSPAHDIAWVAPQAADNTWYPKGFRDRAANAAAMDSALEALDAAGRAVTAHVPPERVVLLGWSQGACLALSWLGSRAVRPGAVVAWTGAATPDFERFPDLAGTRAWISTAADDPWVDRADVQATADALRAAGAAVQLDVAPGDQHAVRPADRAALAHLLEDLMDTLDHQHGFGNALASEARPGALPLHQNGPRQVSYGLYAEQINGTGFTVRRDLNHRVWLYRLRPQILAAPFERVPSGRFAGRFDAGRVDPTVMRFRPVDYPAEPTDFVQSLVTFAGAGDPVMQAGMAIHLYAATAAMGNKAFTDVDGDLLVVPQEGRLHVTTELGKLEVGPGEVLIVPRGIRFTVALPDGRARGFVSELFDGHHQLPERGLVGANGLADERHFRAPVAWYEDVEADWEIVVKQGGDLWRGVSPRSPFDVVAWHGTYAPFAYDLADFVAYWSVTVDHSDPSIHTVLTCPKDATGRNALDFGVFKGRWDPTEHSFRPPFFHRNAAIEFNAVIKSPSNTGPYQAGAFTYTPYLTPHGVSVHGYEREVGKTDAEADAPRRLSDDELWIQWESAYQLRVLPWMFDDAGRDLAYLDQFQGFR